MVMSSPNRRDVMKAIGGTVGFSPVIERAKISHFNPDRERDIVTAVENG